MSTKSRKTLLRALPALLIVLVLVGAACSFGGDDADEPTSRNFDAAPATTFAPAFDDGDEFEAPEPATPPSPGEETGDGELGTGGVALASLQAPNIGRDIIFRADLTVAVADVGTAGEEATIAVEALGGFLFGQQTTGGANPRSVLTFKIAPDNFQAALEALGSIGELRSQNVSADDVTERIVDIESRIRTAEASVERLRELIAGATDVDDIAQLERELLNRETTLETLRGQLRTLENQVALATIVLTLTEADIDPALEITVGSYLGTDSGRSCPGNDEPRYVAGDDVTVCFEIFNIGDTTLTQFTVEDSVLDVELDDLTVVFGDPDSLEPGESLVLATEIVVERDLRTRTTVTAEPVKEETGEIIANRTVSRVETSFLFAEDPGGLPGFSDGLSASWDVLQDVGGLVVLGAGAVIPFAWVLLLVAAYVLWRQRRAPSASASGDSEPAAPETD